MSESNIVNVKLKTGRSIYYLFWGEVQIGGYNSLEEAREVQDLLESYEKAD